jgi:putative tryptophan/tyrosine transport system substrate-binding protein
MFPAMSKLAFVTLRVVWEGIQGPAVRAAAETAGIPLIGLPLVFPASEADYRSAVASASREGAEAIMVGDSS